MTNDQNSTQTVSMDLEQIEVLRALINSAPWKVYRDLLIKTKEAKFLAILPEAETNKVFKAMGEIAGLNHAINQAAMIVGAYDAKVKKQLADKEDVRKSPSPAKLN